MKQLIWALTFSALLLPITIHAAEGPAHDTNGCGADGVQGWLVPDSTLFSQCEFNNACNKHDLCYGRCLDGGDLHGQATCKDETAKQARRKVCDDLFFKDIAEDNNQRPICRLYGNLYRWAVVKWGKGNFRGREIELLALKAFVQGDQVLEFDAQHPAIQNYELKHKSRLLFEQGIELDTQQFQGLNLNGMPAAGQLQ